MRHLVGDEVIYGYGGQLRRGVITKVDTYPTRVSFIINGNTQSIFFNYDIHINLTQYNLLLNEMMEI